MFSSGSNWHWTWTRCSWTWTGGPVLSSPCFMDWTLSSTLGSQKFGENWTEPDFGNTMVEGRKEGKFSQSFQLEVNCEWMSGQCKGTAKGIQVVGSWGWCQVFVSVWLRSDEPTRNMRKSNSVWSEGDFLGLITSPIYRTHSYIRTPESSLRGISIIWINFSKFCLRFTIIRIKIADFLKKFTLLIQIDPADRRLVWQSG